MTMELATEMDFQMDDPEIMEMEGIPVGDVRRQRVYVFKNHVEGINLKISPVFAAVLIEETKYIDFFEYGRTLLEVMALIRRKTEFFSPVRFGLRKINQCVLKTGRPNFDFVCWTHPHDDHTMGMDRILEQCCSQDTVFWMFPFFPGIQIATVKWFGIHIKICFRL